MNEGQDFKSFAMTCARAMGACVTIRDEPFDAPIPTIKPSDYNAKAKLEAIELGQSTIAREFLHDMLAGDPRNNETFGEMLARGKLDQILGNGRPLLPPAGGSTTDD